MPRYRRFHPISHDFNRDPEIIEARQQFGDWIGYAWQECLAIADRNEGVVPGTLDQIADILAPISLQKYTGVAAKQARKFLESISNLARISDESCPNLGWIRVFSDHIEIVKYWEYHRRREAKQAPSEPNLTKPNLIREEEEKIRSARKRGYPTDFQISEDVKAWASEKKLPDPETELEAFRDFHESKGNRFIDWDAAFRTWLRNAKRFRGNGKGGAEKQTDGERLTLRLAQTLRRGL